MKQEIWKDIEGFENYRISDFGNVYSLISKKILKPQINGHGYCQVSFIKDSKKYHRQIHRLMAIAFIPNPSNMPQINHKDGNKSNNDINNLEWTNNKGNMIHARDILGLDYGKYKSSKPIIGINIKTGEKIRFNSSTEANRNGFNHGAISCCCNKKKGYYKHKGYIWYYENQNRIT